MVVNAAPQVGRSAGVSLGRAAAAATLQTRNQNHLNNLY
jgi:hypothetical protein